MTPWELASTSEHSQQRALFAWANCAAMHGIEIADNPAGYKLEARFALGARSHPLPVLSRLFAIHNQGHGDAIRGARAKAEGVKAGVPDVMLPLPITYEDGGFISGTPTTAISCAGLFIELKKPKVGRTSEKQSDWIDYLNNADYRAVTCYGWEAARDEIKSYLKLARLI